MMEYNPRYAIAGIGVAGLMVAGYYPGRLLCQIGTYILPAVAGIGRAGSMIAGLREGAANFRDIRPETLRIEDAGLDVPRASFSLASDVRQQPLEGQQITLAVGTLLHPIFVGYLDEVTESGRDISKNVYECQAVGLTKDLQKRVLIETFLNTYTGEIVRDLITRYAPHFHTEHFIERGTYLPNIIFNGETVLNACVTLATRSNFVFYVDHLRNVHFKQREANRAPWAIVSGERFNDLRISEKSTALKNRIIVRYSELHARTDRFEGDGDTTVFPLSRIPYEVQSLTVNGEARTFGSRYQEDNSGNDFSVYFTEAEIHVQAAPVPKIGDEILVEYTAKIPSKLTVDHLPSQNDRRAKEGGDGIYDLLITDREILTETEAHTRALNELEQYAWPQVTVSYTRTEYLFDLITNRLQVGQLQQIALWNRVAELNIERIHTSVIRPAGDHTLKFLQTVELGPVSRGLEALFEDLAEPKLYATDEIERTFMIIFH